jgi:hypothetical protein
LKVRFLPEAEAELDQAVADYDARQRALDVSSRRRFAKRFPA